MNSKKRKDYLKKFSSLSMVKIPKPMLIFRFLVVGFFIVSGVFLFLTPWIQTAYGEGRVTTLEPSGRPQAITAPLKGRIKEWHVKEGERVKKNQKIAMLVDNDPDYMQRIESELDVAQRRLDVARSAVETAKLNYNRRKKLFQEGLNSQFEYEQAKIAYAEFVAKQAAVEAEIINIQTRKSRQQTQEIYAPSDGVILQIRSNDEVSFIKEGDILAYFVPEKSNPVVEIYVRGIDAPLIEVGKKVRLQFEGWPAVQFSGWPAISVGSFGGIVSSIDPSVSVNGRFRVIVTQDPDEPWPNQNFIRYGTRVNGWILMSKVKVGYEIWRQLNNFPPEYPPSFQADEMLVHYSETQSGVASGNGGQKK